MALQMRVKQSIGHAQSHLTIVEQFGFFAIELAVIALTLCYDSSDVTVLTAWKIISVHPTGSTLVR